MIDLSKPGKVHVIGIAGAGMSAVALLLRDLGWQVTASDGELVYPPISTYLDDQNIAYNKGYAAGNFGDDVGFFMVGKNYSLKAENNVEVAAAVATGKPVLSYPDVLNQLTAQKHNAVVVGSYGKSTTTSLLAWALQHAGKSPSYFVGAMVLGMDRTSQHGKGDVFVLEGDEYPTSNTDPRAKFLSYNAKDVILTSATHDHLEIFKTKEDYHAPFQQLLGNMPADGKLVACVDNADVCELLESFNGTSITYGIESTEAEWSAENIQLSGTSTFDLTHSGKTVGSFSTKLLGRHNIQNMVGVAALCLSREWLTVAELQAAFASFGGVRRRLVPLAPTSSVPVFEAFGSTDLKLQAALRAVKEHFPTKRIVLVFEPSTFGWRCRDAAHWYRPETFANADQVIVTWLPDFAVNDTSFTYTDVQELVRQSGKPTEALDSADAVMNWLQQNANEDDVYLLSSSRTLMGLVEQIPTWLTDRFKQAA